VSPSRKCALLDHFYTQLAFARVVVPVCVAARPGNGDLLGAVVQVACLSQVLGCRGGKGQGRARGLPTRSAYPAQNEASRIPHGVVFLVGVEQRRKISDGLEHGLDVIDGSRRAKCAVIYSLLKTALLVSADRPFSFNARP
jgi:hypothetical protein